MTDMALYARADGMLEPRSTKSIEFVKSVAGRMLIADIEHDVRTSLQNRFLNSWVYRIQICGKLNDAGILNPVGAMWTRDNIHAIMQDLFLLKEEFLLNGKHIRVYESTAKMSRKRFCKYIDEEIRPFVLSMWGITVDDPREGFWMEVYKEIMSRH